MYCKECGTKNEENAEFCSKCGKKLTKESKKVAPATEKSTGDAGGIRKAIKKDAKSRVNGHLIGATAIYLVVCVIISAIFQSTTTVTNGTGVASNVTVSTTSPFASILTYLVSVIFAYGLLMVCFKAIKGEKFEFSEVFLKPFENIKFIGYALLLTIIVSAISFVLIIIPILGWIALIVGYVYYMPVISTFMIRIADPKTSKDISFTEALKQSMEIVKGNRIEYYGVTFSFIGWILLSILTFGILLIWLTPYMELAYVNLYQKWTKEKDFKTTDTGLSNGAVVGITAGGCGCGCLMMIIIVIATIGIFAGVLKDHINDPQIRSFIDKYSNSQSINDDELERDLNDIYNSYSSNYNS